jgi:hypothetical protein
MATEVHLIQDDLEEQIGPMGLGADAGIGVEHGGQIELVDGLVDGAGEMVGGERVLDLEPLGGGAIPGRRSEAVERGKILVWVRSRSRVRIEGAVWRFRPRMVLGWRRKYHGSRAPLVEGAGDHPQS